jgi:hypothetical protein
VDLEIFWGLGEKSSRAGLGKKLSLGKSFSPNSGKKCALGEKVSGPVLVKSATLGEKVTSPPVGLLACLPSGSRYCNHSTNTLPLVDLFSHS